MSEGVHSHQPIRRDTPPRRYTINTEEITGNSLSTAIALTLAKAAGEEVLKLSPLHETVDTAALDTIFRHYDASGLDRADAYLCFVHDGYRIIVYCDGRIVVQE